MELSRYVTNFTDCELIYSEDLKKHNSFKTGGKADWFLLPKNVKAITDALWFCKEKRIKYFISGNGTNVLYSDGGFRGAVISFEKMRGISVTGQTLTAFAGEKLSDLCFVAFKNSLCGLEELCGIPGSVGGAVYMNAGAFGKSVSDYIQTVTVLRKGKLLTLLKKDCRFSYRKSGFCGKDVIVSVKFNLNYAKKTQIKEKMQEFSVKRVSSQPKGFSCGSVFKNPQGYFAAKLIEGAGLKGLKYGGAEISNKHANFIINVENATSNDIYTLITTAKEAVKNKYGVSLKEEVVYVGDFK